MFFFFQAEDGIRDGHVTGVQTCALPIYTQAARYGFAVQHVAVQLPGLDQKATWLRVHVAQPDWVMLQGGGVMISTALKEAAQVGVPRDKIVGNQASCN